MGLSSLPPAAELLLFLMLVLQLSLLSAVLRAKRLRVGDHCTAQHCTALRHGMAWRGVAWRGMAWGAVVWGREVLPSHPAPAGPQRWWKKSKRRTSAARAQPEKQSGEWPRHRAPRKRPTPDGSPDPGLCRGLRGAHCVSSLGSFSAGRERIEAHGDPGDAVSAGGDPQMLPQDPQPVPCSCPHWAAVAAG